MQGVVATSSTLMWSSDPEWWQLLILDGAATVGDHSCSSHRELRARVIVAARYNELRSCVPSSCSRPSCAHSWLQLLVCQVL